MARGGKRAVVRANQTITCASRRRRGIVMRDVREEGVCEKYAVI